MQLTKKGRRKSDPYRISRNDSGSRLEKIAFVDL